MIMDILTPGKLQQEENKKDFNIYIGTETGILKGVNLNQKAVIRKSFHNIKALDKDEEITSMAWGNEEQTEVLMGLRNQTIRVFDTDVKAFVSSRKISIGKGPIVSLGRLDGVTITAVKSGEVNLWRRKELVEINALGGGEFLTCMRQKPSAPHLLATGGKEADLTLWDLNTPKEPAFRAKNVKPDMLELRVPVWVTDIAFLDDHDTVAVSSRHKHIRLYDPERQRRPVVSFEWGDSPLTCISPISAANRQVVVGTAHGRMGLFDLRGKVEEPLRVFKGFSGAVRNVTAHTNHPLLFSVSLDRFLRVHHLHSGKLLFQEYLKSRLNCLLVRKDLDFSDFVTKPKESRKRNLQPNTAPTSEPNAKQSVIQELPDKMWESLKT